ncbi:hypothetical protein [Pseudomonas serbica]|jgi:hypothetical protein|uniref:hypothetical protein n=1 Tax=Pseudomonas serbica TaxID=2965074 RepID=UPI00237C4763|nr:hypothetical protein [Pseudomonas serbica]
MGWRDTLDTAFQKSKDKIVETVTVDNAKKAISAVAVAAATAAVEKVREEMGKQRERRELFEKASDDVLSRVAKSGDRESDASSRMAASVLERRLRGLESKTNDELRIIAASYSHSEAERERASAILRRR